MAFPQARSHRERSAARVSAATALLDRGYGKPLQAIAQTLAKLDPTVLLSDDELACPQCLSHPAPVGSLSGHAIRPATAEKPFKRGFSSGTAAGPRPYPQIERQNVGLDERDSHL